MDEGTIALLVTSLGIFAVFAGLFIWGLVTKQFRNVEEPKYRFFEMENDPNAEGNKEANTKDGDTKKGEEAHA